MLHRIVLLALAAPRRVLAATLLVFVTAAIFGIPVVGSLSAGGFNDPATESAQANKLLTDKFGVSDQQLLIVVTAPDGIRSEQGQRIGTDIVEHLEKSPYVLDVWSAWTSTQQAATGLVSKDGKSGLIVGNLEGPENDAEHHAKALSDEVVHNKDGVTVRAGGIPLAYAQVNEQSQHDLILMETIAIPLSFVALVWVFGGLFTAALPVAVGLIAIVGSLSVLRLITYVTEVSTFALNLATALGFALAIDYTLLIISRYRDELATGATSNAALFTTMATAGRTVVFSAITVALSMAMMALFPMYFLRSFAYAGVTIVAFAAVAAIVVTPAAIVLLGHRLNALDVRRMTRRLLRRPDPVPRPIEMSFWYRSTKRVMRHAVPIGLAVVALLLLLGAPFVGVKLGFSDDRLLPPSASAHQVGDQLRNDFAIDPAASILVVIPDVVGLDQADLERYAADLSLVPDVAAVAVPSGTFVSGVKMGPPVAPTGLADGSGFLTVVSTAPLSSEASDTQLDEIRDVMGPAGRSVQISGLAQINRDSVDAITSRLPLVLGLIAALTYTLLFLLTGSVLLPLKALILNVLSLAATFGALVWIFQDGHFGALGTTPTGTLVASMPVLLFCIAFGLSMDYEVFLVSRFREHWISSARTSQASDEGVALGVARTGRVITAAALLMSISFAALTASEVPFMRMFGLGLTLAVLMDATLIRTVLVPAMMHVMGKANWWAPKPLAALHNRVGISESGVAGSGRPIEAPATVVQLSSAQGKKL
ncbi:MMPL family transporter [Rhodococcus erythropolis]|uniref:MMPL family transporter n=1 Tax=Rhodococcus erythropolis TaxID=1833 RepID=A0AAX3ZZ01_RHOER|nr:MMPL family transporter [Rhodococcus erythropolis]WMN02133.1 MMPL family transporter [Rhodococcus erythropolis]WMN03108.1 MMPL family transporter [Rhodococcus erythropolis]